MAAAIYSLAGLCALVLLGFDAHSVFGIAPDPVLDTFGRTLGMPWILAAPVGGPAIESLVWYAAAMALNLLLIICLGWMLSARR
jgi:hypothetical protein